MHLELQGGPNQAAVTLDGRAPRLDAVRLSHNAWSLIIDGQSYRVSVEADSEGYLVHIRQRRIQVRLRSELDLTIEKLGLTDRTLQIDGQVVAPIPGVITSVSVSEGDSVAQGDQLLVLEAMKMENELRSPLAGTVAIVHVSAGETVNKGALLLELRAH
ncbi:MAG: biotin/lipoyl-containing protein [Candidatus Neomarinimicrobiota bacterium]